MTKREWQLEEYVRDSDGGPKGKVYGAGDNNRDDLRDTFAAAALTGLLATGQGPYHGENYFAKAAYKAADAILRERTAAKHADVRDPDQNSRVWETHPSPTLTDAEREAVEWCVEMAATTASDCAEEVAALRGLLERTK